MQRGMEMLSLIKLLTGLNYMMCKVTDKFCSIFREVTATLDSWTERIGLVTLGKETHMGTFCQEMTLLSSGYLVLLV